MKNLIQSHTVISGYVKQSQEWNIGNICFATCSDILATHLLPDNVQWNIDTIDRFAYLRSSISNASAIDSDVTQGTGKAMAICQRICTLWSSNITELPTKIWLYIMKVLPGVLYSSDTWKNTMKIDRKLDGFHSKCMKRIWRMYWQDHVTIYIRVYVCILSIISLITDVD